MHIVPHILLILGHPSSQSFNSALVDAYAESAQSAGAEVRILRLGDLDFDPILRPDSTTPQTLEADLIRAQEDLLWAHHTVWFFPVWWGSAPALLRGFIDRVFLPGWAFNVRGNGMPIKHLAGRTARTVVTMDSPKWFYQLWYARSAHKTIERATLWFCGIRVTARNTLSILRTSTAPQRAQWLLDLAKEARRDVERTARWVRHGERRASPPRTLPAVS